MLKKITVLLLALSFCSVGYARGLGGGLGSSKNNDPVDNFLAPKKTISDGKMTQIGAAASNSVAKQQAAEKAQVTKTKESDGVKSKGLAAGRPGNPGQGKSSNNNNKSGGLTGIR